MAACAIDNEYLYTALPGEDYIRTLTIQPALNLDDDLVCELEDAPIASAEYAALSYSWAMQDGDASFCRSITLGGKMKLVTRNLFEGMHRIRLTDKPLRIWIDALSIDQSNTLERNSQVSRMADIFRNATGVLVWLGEGRTQKEDEDMEAIFVRLSQHTAENMMGFPLASCVLCSVLDANSEDCDCTTHRRLEREQIEDSMRKWLDAEPAHYKRGVSAWTAIQAFVARRYWTRRWITQELFHARAQSWYWGPCVRNDFESMQGWWHPVVGYSLHDFLQSNVQLMNLTALDDNQRLSESQRTLRLKAPRGFASASHSSGRRISLVEALLDAKGQDCSDPRDKIFAIASMWEPAIAPDYRLSLAQVYSRATHALLDSGGVGFWVQALYKRWLEGSSSTLYAGWPSWVIDPDEIEDTQAQQRKIAGSHSHPTLSTTVSTDNTLTCEVRCLGIFAKTGSNAGNFEISWAQPFNDCDEWCWDPDLAPNLEDLIRNNRLRIKSSFPDSCAYRPDDSPSLHRPIQPGDALCTLVQGPWLPYLEFLVLRSCEDLTSTYKIVDVIHPASYVTESGAQGYLDFFDFDSTAIDHDAGSDCDQSWWRMRGIDGDDALASPVSQESAKKNELHDCYGRPLGEVTMTDSLFFSVKTTINII